MNDQLSAGPWEQIHRELGVAAPEFDDRPLGAYLESYAQSTPDNTALRYFDRDISYSELNVLTNRVANALVALGVERGDVIGVQMPTIPQYAVVLLAASKLGVTLSSVSPLLAPGEIARQLEDAQIKVLLSVDELANTSLTAISSIPDCVSDFVITSASDFLQPSALQLPELLGVNCHSYLEITADASPDFQQVELPHDHVVLIQYTGGTTGPAKGAQLTLRGFMHNGPANQIYRPWEVGAETCASAAPLFHIAGMILLAITLRYGGRYVLIPNPRDIDHFCQQMIDCPPTRIGCVPTALSNDC